MTTPTRPRSSPGRYRHSGAALRLLRAIATVHVIAVFAQPAFAGGYLGGDYDMLAVHAIGADVVSYLGYAQLLVAVAVWAVRGPRWPTAASAALVAAETGQYFAGMAGALSLHLPLGVAIVAGALLVLVALVRTESQS